jgi:3,4-dihydroxy 2-butanone 4-phosphate synthase/GTP cyclohydrolase II
MFKLADALLRNNISLIVDSDGEENPSALVLVGETLTESILNRALTLAKGPIHLVVSSQRADAFGLQMMSSSRRFAPNSEGDAESQCISIEAREGVTTGISIADRTCTLKILSERTPDRRKIVSPGHIVPYCARDGGVLIRHSIKEAALDLVKASGASDAAVVIDCLNSQGEFLSAAELAALLKELGVEPISVNEIVRARLRSEPLISREAETAIPSDYGSFKGIIYKTPLQGREPLVLIKGDLNLDEPVLTRIHVENSFEDIFGSNSLASRRRLLHKSMQLIDQNGSGVILYLRKGSEFQRSSQVVVARKSDRIKEYGLGAQVLLDLGIKKIKLLTNSNNNLVGLNSFGIDIVATQPLEIDSAEAAI